MNYEAENEQLRADIKALETALQGLVVLLADKGVITTDEWKETNAVVYRMNKRDAK